MDKLFLDRHQVFSNNNSSYDSVQTLEDVGYHISNYTIGKITCDEEKRNINIPITLNFSPNSDILDAIVKQINDKVKRTIID